jgi:hypothetical protein
VALVTFPAVSAILVANLVSMVVLIVSQLLIANQPLAYVMLAWRCRMMSATRPAQPD